MTDAELIERIRALSRPLTPRPTDVEARLVPLPDLQAVLFDIYGTLFISAAGDIGVGLAVDGDSAFRAALEAVGLPARGGAELLTRAIEAEHARKRAAGIDHPEVDIVAIWHTVLAQMELSAPEPTLRRLALEYELRVNPVWPMPGLAETIDALRCRGLRLGVISNAQFFTPLLFPALLGRSLAQLGFAPQLCIYSWQVGIAKPSPRLYERAAAELDHAGIEPGRVLYVGNDMRNDIWPADLVGFRTGLFAGDARSLRLREDDPRCRNVQPTCVFKSLPQILECR
ncbi:MAG TPA: HAD family hydrolase [Methylothermaceae bacterium]|nr:HAD family hydrolase [Methylothermaceae bacterium]